MGAVVSDLEEFIITELRRYKTLYDVEHDPFIDAGARWSSGVLCSSVHRIDKAFNFFSGDPSPSLEHLTEAK